MDTAEQMARGCIRAGWRSMQRRSPQETPWGQASIWHAKKCSSREACAWGTQLQRALTAICLA